MMAEINKPVPLHTLGIALPPTCSSRRLTSASSRACPPEGGGVGRCSGNGRRAGFCAATSTTAGTAGDAVASRSVWSVSSSRAPARAARCRAPASPRNRRTQLADKAPIGTQPGNLRLSRQRILRHRSDDTLQCSGVVGQIVGRDWHPRSGPNLQQLWGWLNHS